MSKLRAASRPQADAVIHRKPLKQRLAENWQLYLLLLIPVIIILLIIVNRIAKKASDVQFV